MEIIDNIFANVFGFWPLLILAVIPGVIRARGKAFKTLKFSLQTMILLWGIFALVLAYAVALHLPLKIYFIPEPLNTRIFFLTGFLLFGLQLLVIFVFKRYDKVAIYNVQSVEGLLKLPAEEIFENIAAYFCVLGHEVKVIDPVKDSETGSLFIKTKLKRNWIVILHHSKQRATEHQLVKLMDCVNKDAADLGVLISTSGVPQNLVQLAKFQPIKLLDGSHLLKMFNRLYVLKIRSFAGPTSSRAAKAFEECEKNTGSKRSLKA